MNPDYEAGATLMINQYANDAPSDLKTICVKILASWLDQGIREYARGRLAPVSALHKSGVAAILYPWHKPAVAA